MNNVGFVERRRSQGNPDAFIGEVLLPDLAGDIAIVPHHLKRSERSPDYAIKFRKQVAGAVWAAIGNAWVKESGKKAAETADKRLLSLDTPDRFLSITVDAPTMPAPINLSLFPGDERTGDDKGTGAPPAVYDLVWGRARRGNRSGADAADVAVSEPLGDEIPY